MADPGATYFYKADAVPTIILSIESRIWSVTSYAVGSSYWVGTKMAELSLFCAFLEYSKSQDIMMAIIRDRLGMPRKCNNNTIKLFQLHSVLETLTHYFSLFLLPPPPPTFGIFISVNYRLKRATLALSSANVGYDFQKPLKLKA